MCLIVFAYEIHAHYRLVLAANRDEFFTRPTRPLHWWEQPKILAGRDLQGGGSWLGLDRTGRLAAVTNVRNPRDILPGRRSRGELVPAFLSQPETGPEFVAGLDSAAYPGYNLLLFDRSGLTWHSNRSTPQLTLRPGLYALSNAALDTPWPKVERAKALLAELLASRAPLTPAALLDLLADRSQPADAELPDTGVGPAWERLLAPLFIHGSDYGTRCSTALLYGHDGRIQVVERSHDQGAGNSDRKFAWTVDEAGN